MKKIISVVLFLIYLTTLVAQVTREAIIKAIHAEDIAFLESIKEYEKDLDVGQDTLFSYAKLGEIEDVPALCYLIDKRILRPDMVYPSGVSIFNFACYYGNQDIIEDLLSSSKDEKELLKQGYNFHYVNWSGNYEGVKFLYKKYQFEDEKDLSDRKSLFYAIKYGNKKQVRFLIKKGYSTCEISGTSNMIDLVGLNGLDNLVRLAIKNDKCTNRNLFLHHFVELKPITFKKVIKEYGLQNQLDNRGIDGENVLMQGIDNPKANLKTLSYLVQLGVNPKHLDKNGNTILYYALNSKENAAFCIRQEVNINHINKEGRTALGELLQKLSGLISTFSFLDDVESSPSEAYLELLETYAYLVESRGFVSETGDGYLQLKNTLLDLSKDNYWNFFEEKYIFKK